MVIFEVIRIILLLNSVSVDVKGDVKSPIWRFLIDQVSLINHPCLEGVLATWEE